MAEYERPAEISWKLQIKWPNEPWRNHTGGLFTREDADALLAEQRRANPKRQWRLVRVTTTYTVEAPS